MKKCKKCGKPIPDGSHTIILPIFECNFRVDTWYFHGECFDPENLPELDAPN